MEREKIINEFLDELIKISEDINKNLKNGFYSAAVEEVISCQRKIKEISESIKEIKDREESMSVRKKLIKLKKSVERNSLIIASNLKSVNDVISAINSNETGIYTEENNSIKVLN